MYSIQKICGILETKYNTVIKCPDRGVFKEERFGITFNEAAKLIRSEEFKTVDDRRFIVSIGMFIEITQLTGSGGKEVKSTDLKLKRRLAEYGLTNTSKTAEALAINWDLNKTGVRAGSKYSYKPNKDSFERFYAIIAGRIKEAKTTGYIFLSEEDKKLIVSKLADKWSEYVITQTIHQRYSGVCFDKVRNAVRNFIIKQMKESTSFQVKVDIPEKGIIESKKEQEESINDEELMKRITKDMRRKTSLHTLSEDQDDPSSDNKESENTSSDDNPSEDKLNREPNIVDLKNIVFRQGNIINKYNNLINEYKELNEDLVKTLLDNN